MLNRQILTRGAVAGLVGGIAIAMWSMIVLWLTGAGFWTPLNLIAHTLWRGAPLDGTFSLGALLIGMAVHMMMSIGLGVVLATLASRFTALSANRGTLALFGMAFGLAVWAVMQFAAWRIVDPAAAPLFTPWVFAVAHLMYGAVAGLGLPVSARVLHRQTAS